MVQRVFALSFAAFTLPIALALTVLSILAWHNQLYGFGPALLFIAIAMALSGISSARSAFKVEITPLSVWLGKRYRRALLSRDFKHARRWNALARRNAAKTAYKPTIVPAAVFFIVGMALVVPSVFAVTFY